MQRARTPEARAHKRELILDSAKELFLEKGFQQTTIEGIMQRAGLSVGTYYLYFKNKTEIFKALLNEAIGILDELFREALLWSSPASKDRLQGLVRAYLDFFHQNPEYFSILALLSVQSSEMRERQSKLGKEIEKKNLLLLEKIRSIIEDGQKRGEFCKDLDSWLASVSLWGMMDGVLLLEKRENLKTVQIDLDDLIRNSLLIFLQGISA